MELVKGRLKELYNVTYPGEQTRELLIVFNQMVVGMELLDARLKRIETLLDNWSKK